MHPLTFYPFMALGWAVVHFLYLSIYGKPKASVLTDAKELKTYYKTRTAVWRGLAFTFSTIYGIIIAIVEVWPIHPDAYFPAQEFAPFDPITPFNEGYWMSMFGFYFYDLIWSCLAMIQVHRSKWPAELGKDRADFVEIVVHHVVTLVLVVCSRYIELYRFGTVVFWMHDVADPFLYAAKVAYYQGVIGLSDGLLYTYTFMFIVFLNVLFPIILIWFSVKGVQRQDIRSSSRLGLLLFCIICCFILVLLHIGTTWSSLKLIWKKVRGKASIKSVDNEAKQSN